jgi:unsaturated rhamnogalacturonyl hydrolase
VRALALVFATLTIVAAFSQAARAQELPWSQRVADQTLKRWPDGRFVPAGAPWNWDHQTSVLLQGVEAVWYNTADGDDFRYIKDSVDPFLSADGSSIRTYDPLKYSVDDVLLGRQLLLLYAVTQNPKYYRAATLLRDQLALQPRTPEGGFWHIGNRPQQMSLDNLYMLEPFYAEYAHTFNQPEAFDDITKQFVLSETHLRDPKTGLVYPTWDEARLQPWADKTTGASPVFWSRAMGWDMMALVDTIGYYDANNPGRAKLLAILNRLAAAIVRYQDADTGLWYQVTDQPNGQGNYLEASSSCMFAYALAKAVRLGYLPQNYFANASRAYEGVVKKFIQVDADGSVTLNGTARGSDLSPNQTRENAYAFYSSVPVVSNDARFTGVFLMASVEMETAPLHDLGKGKTLLFDGWFNSQMRKDASGQMVPVHYKEHDKANSGYSFFAHIFHTYGVTTSTLTTAPTLQNLAHANIYVMVPPDVPLWNPHPNYIKPADVAQIAAWVKQGGVLVIMTNDPLNTDIPGLCRLGKPFGIQYQNVTLYHQVAGDPHSMGKIDVPAGGPVFHSAHTFYMKDTTALTLSGDATPVLTANGNVLMASAKYGRGTVFSVVDPWIYNEYTDGRNLPHDEYDNYAGGWEVVRWLIAQVPAGPRRD